METRLAKKPKILKQEEESNWTLDIDLTNYIISFIPFVRRGAIFRSCKFLNQVCFIDFWSSNISIRDYLNYIRFSPVKSKYELYNIAAIIGIFESGNVIEMKLLCRYKRCEFITDFLYLVPIESFCEILRWALTQMGINQPIFEKVAEECCRNGPNEIFELLVSNGLYEANWLAPSICWFGKSNTKGLNLLYDAAQSGRIQIIKSLIENLSFTREELSIALNGAFEKNSFVERFHWRARNNKNIDTLAVVKFLISKGADLNYRRPDFYPPLLAAFRKGNLEVIDYLLEEGVNVQEKFNDHDILSMATYSLSIEAIEKALQLGSIKSITGVKYLGMFLGESSRHYKRKEEKIVKVCLKLFEIGARVGGKDEETIELLIFTCEHEMLEIVQLFASRGADYSLFIEKFGYFTSPLHAAIYAENLEIVKYLVNDLKVPLKPPKDQFYSPLFYAATMIKSREITTFLLESGATAIEMNQIMSFLDSNSVETD